MKGKIGFLKSRFSCTALQGLPLMMFEVFGTKLNKFQLGCHSGSNLQKLHNLFAVKLGFHQN